MSNVPKLRFSEFSEEWEEKNLKQISKQISYGLTIRPEYIKEGIPLISARELKGGKINYDDAPKISQKAYDELSEKAKAQQGDIFLTKTGTIGLSSYVWLNIPIAITQNIAVIRIDKLTYNHQFILQTFKTKKFLDKTISKVNQSTIMDLQLQDIRKLIITLPSKPEQEKIASFLTSVDTKIEQLTKKETLLQEYKKGVMNKIFNQEIRFKDDDRSEFPEWEEKRLEDLAQIIGGGTPETSKEKYWNGDIQWFTPTEIKFDYVSESIRTISELGLKKSSAKILPIGTILLTTRATIGEVSIALRECTTNQGFQSLVVKSNHSNIFIFNWIKNNKYKFISKANGSTFPEISKSEIEKIKITIPSLKEQTKIANFLSSIDKKIELTTKELNSTKEFKKALLQQMFV